MSITSKLRLIKSEKYQTLCIISFPLICMTPIPDDEEENVSEQEGLGQSLSSIRRYNYKRRSGTESSSHNSLNCFQKNIPNSSKNEIRKLFLYF
jgi:hypothetical protein